MKKINIEQLAALLAAVIIITVINPTVSVIFMAVMVALTIGVLAFGVDPDNIWPTVPYLVAARRLGLFTGLPSLKQNPDGTFTVSLHDAAAKGNLFVSDENVLYKQKAVDSIKREAVKEGVITGVVYTMLAIGIGYGVYKYAKRRQV